MRRLPALLLLPLLSACGGAADPPPADPRADTPAASSEAPSIPVATTDEVPMPAPATTETPTTEEESRMVMGGVGAPAAETLPFEMYGDACRGFGRFIDIEEGVQVTIKGASDNIVALTELGPAQFNEEYEECFWMFTADIPTGEGFYIAEIEDFGKSPVMAEEDLLNYEPFVIAP